MKYIPHRICCVCRKKQPQSELLRIAHTDSGYVIDHDGKSEGRGAYVCKSPECLKACIKKHALNRSFHTVVPEEIYAELGKLSDKN